MSEIPAGPSSYILSSRPLSGFFWGSLIRAHLHLVNPPGLSLGGQWLLRVFLPRVSLRLVQTQAHTPWACGHTSPWCDLKFSAPGWATVGLSVPCVPWGVFAQQQNFGSSGTVPWVVFQGVYPGRKQCECSLFSPGPTCVLGSVSLRCTKSSNSGLCTSSAFSHSNPLGSTASLKCNLHIIQVSKFKHALEGLHRCAVIPATSCRIFLSPRKISGAPSPRQPRIYFLSLQSCIFLAFM